MSKPSSGSSRKLALLKLYEQFNDYAQQLQSSIQSPSSSPAAAAENENASPSTQDKVPSRLLLDSTISTPTRQVRFQSEVVLRDDNQNTEQSAPMITKVETSQGSTSHSRWPSLEGGALSFSTFREMVGPLLEVGSGELPKVNYDMEMEVVEYKGDKSIATIDATYGRDKGYSQDQPFDFSLSELVSENTERMLPDPSQVYSHGRSLTTESSSSSSSIPDAQDLGRGRLSKYGVREPPNDMTFTQHAAARSARSVVRVNRAGRVGAAVRKSFSIPSLLAASNQHVRRPVKDRTRGQGLQLSVHYLLFFFVMPLSFLALYNIIPWFLHFAYPRWSQSRFIEIKEELPPVIHMIYPSFMKKSWLRSSFRIGIWAIELGGFFSLFMSFNKGYMIFRWLRPRVVRRNRDSYLLEQHMQMYGTDWEHPDESAQESHHPTPSYDGLLKWQNRDPTGMVLIDETGETSVSDSPVSSPLMSLTSSNRTRTMRSSGTQQRTASNSRGVGNNPTGTRGVGRGAVASRSVYDVVNQPTGTGNVARSSSIGIGLEPTATSSDSGQSFATMMPRGLFRKLGQPIMKKSEKRRNSRASSKGRRGSAKSTSSKP